MTPKEKAKELVYDVFWLDGMDFQNSKWCALNAIDLAREFITGDLSESFDKTMYLFEIKQEIEKL